jgi:hypothetical protein
MVSMMAYEAGGAAGESVAINPGINEGPLRAGAKRS